MPFRNSTKQSLSGEFSTRNNPSVMRVSTNSTIASSQRTIYKRNQDGTLYFRYLCWRKEQSNTVIAYIIIASFFDNLLRITARPGGVHHPSVDFSQSVLHSIRLQTSSVQPIRRVLTRVSIKPLHIQVSVLRTLDNLK